MLYLNILKKWWEKCGGGALRIEKRFHSCRDNDWVCSPRWARTESPPARVRQCQKMRSSFRKINVKKWAVYVCFLKPSRNCMVARAEPIAKSRSHACCCCCSRERENRTNLLLFNNWMIGALLFARREMTWECFLNIIDKFQVSKL